MTASRLRVNKATFLDSRICPTRGWLARRGAAEPTAGHRLRREEGIEVGRRSRQLYPGGVLVEATNLQAAAQQSQDLMADARVPTIFEAMFLVDGYPAKADLLVRSGRGWKLLEVKSGLHPRVEYVEDLAYTLLVARRGGVKINSASLVLLSPRFPVWNGGPRTLRRTRQDERAP